MSSNETQIASAAMTDVKNMQAAPMSTSEELVITYQREDGTVESARNAEDAIARCPVLGRLAIDAPDQASILLELAAKGNAKIAAETKNELKQPMRQEKLSEPDPTHIIKPEKKIPESSPKDIVKAELPVIVNEPVEARPPIIKVDTASYPAGTGKLELHQQETLHTFENSVEANTNGVVFEKRKVEALKENSAIYALPTTNKDKTEPVKSFEMSRDESVASAPLINLEVKQYHQLDTEIKGIAEDSARMAHSKEAIVTTSYEPTSITEELVNVLNVVHETTDTETALGPDDLQVSDCIFNMVNKSPAKLEDYEIGAEPSENSKPLFESETIETYSELRSLIAEQVVRETIPTKTVESEMSILNLYETESELELVESLTFEAFVPTQSESEKVTLESIKVKSSEQPLEQTISQLVEYITNSVEDDEQLESIWVVIKDIEKSLPKYYFGQEPEEVRLQITPEMTDKLLMLLRELGYQNPREALTGMVSRFGFAFLLQSLSYLLQLKDENNRRELLGASTSASNSGVSPLSILRKLIMKTIIGKELFPDNLTT